MEGRGDRGERWLKNHEEHFGVGKATKVTTRYLRISHWRHLTSNESPTWLIFADPVTLIFIVNKLSMLLTSSQHYSEMII